MRPDENSLPANAVKSAGSLMNSTMSDWTREQSRPSDWNPGSSIFARMRVHKRYQLQQCLLASMPKRWTSLLHSFWAAVIAAPNPLNCQSERCSFVCKTNGAAMYTAAEIDPNSLIFQQVTMGTRDGAGAPKLQGHVGVGVGAGAKLLGSICLSEYSRIGANAQVLVELADHAMEAGVLAGVRGIGDG